MYVLKPSHRLVAALATTPSTNVVSFVANYIHVTIPVEVESEADTLYVQHGELTSTWSALVSSPPSATTYLVRQVSIFNNDTVAHTVTVAIEDTSSGTIYRRLARVVLQPQQTLHYNSASGWYVDRLGNRDEVYYRTLTVAVSGEMADLTTGTNKVVFRAPTAMYLPRIPRASVRTAPVGSAIRVDIKANGTSVLGSLLQIDAGSKTSANSTSPATLATDTIPDDAEIAIDIVQVGSTTPGAGLKVTLYFVPQS